MPSPVISQRRQQVRITREKVLIKMSDSSVNDHQIDSQGGDGVTVEGRGGDVGLAGGEGIVSESVVRAEGVGGGGVSLVMPLLRVRTINIGHLFIY